MKKLIHIPSGETVDALGEPKEYMGTLRYQVMFPDAEIMTLSSEDFAEQTELPNMPKPEPQKQYAAVIREREAEHAGKPEIEDLPMFGAPVQENLFGQKCEENSCNDSCPISEICL